MRVTFPRLPDCQRSYSLVEPDNGVVSRRPGEIAGPRLPRDIMQLVVERELHITDGIWAHIASGGGGTAPNQARAEQLADLVASVAALEDPALGQVQRLAAAHGFALPAAGIAAAAQVLQVEAARWAHLRVGEHLRYDWPFQVRYRPASLRLTLRACRCRRRWSTSERPASSTPSHFSPRRMRGSSRA